MLQTGIVKQTYKNLADVEIQRGTACGESCASCGLCAGHTTVVTALNEINSVIGDKVAIEMPGKKVLGAAFLVYIVPLIALFIGYFAGNAVFAAETSAIFSGIILMAAVFLIIILLDKIIKYRYTPRITHIIS